MKEKLQKLLSVKSIVTLIATAVFAYLSITGAISGQEFLTVFTVIVSFYFGTQYEKKGAGVENSAEACADPAACPYKIEPKNEVVEV
jgi:hypothetical protein